MRTVLNRFRVIAHEIRPHETRTIALSYMVLICWHDMIIPFCHNPCVSQTDRWTDGQTERQTKNVQQERSLTELDAR